MAARWEPILDGALAAAAVRTAREIGDELGAQVPRQAPPWEAALFWAYAAGAFDDAITAERYDAAVDALVARVGKGFGTLHLYGGLAGAGFVLSHLTSDGADQDLAAFDEVLVTSLAADPWLADYDLIRGITGLGVYFLERLATAAPSPSARAGLERVVHHLAATARTVDAGITWLTRPEWLPEWLHERAPAGHYNCGVAHGVPGVIAMLGRAAALSDPPPHASDLAARATAWVLSQRLEPDPRGRFPSWITADRVPDRARTAWCYGDPGIAAAVWSAARRTGQPEDEWRALAREAATRSPEHCGVRDACLCHGAIGLAHLYNRCFQASGDEVFRDAARGWFAHGLGMRRPGEGVAGFLQFGPAVHGRAREWEANDDFLDGAIGIGLALLAAIGAEEPGWDRLLLCDIPPRAGAGSP